MEPTKSRWTRRVEVSANVVIVVTGLLFALNYFRPGLFSRSAGPQPVTISTGAKLDLASVDWSAHDKTVVLALREGCHFCAESVPFYQRLTKAMAKAPQTHLFAVLPGDPADSKQYLNGLGVPVPVDDIRKHDLGNLKVPYTPTLLVLDRDGVVREVFVGKLSAAKETEVLNKLGLAE
jgi:hypothetical protein